LEKKEKQTFREWAENIWYYYKWLVLFIGLMIVFAVICIVQLAQKDEPDVDVMFVGPGYYLDQASKEIPSSLYRRITTATGNSHSTCSISPCRSSKPPRARSMWINTTRV